MPRIVFFAISLVLAAACGEGYPAAGNSGNNAVADAGCPCPACPEADAGVCPECPEPPAPEMTVSITSVVDNRRSVPTHLFFMGEVSNFHGDAIRKTDVSWWFGSQTGTAEEVNGRIWFIQVPVAAETEICNIIKITVTDRGGRTGYTEQAVCLPAALLVQTSGSLAVTQTARTPIERQIVQPDTRQLAMEIMLSAGPEEPVAVSQLHFQLDGPHSPIYAWYFHEGSTQLALGAISSEYQRFEYFAPMGAPLVVPANGSRTLQVFLDTSNLQDGDEVEMELAHGVAWGAISHNDIPVRGTPITSYQYSVPIIPPPAPRLTVHFSASSPSGASAPASNETMVKAILSASLDEDIRVDTLTFRVRATNPGLNSWALRWDNGPPGNSLDSGATLEYSSIDWAIITAHVNMELSAGSNLAVSLYMDTQAMRYGDVVSLQINGAEGVGMNSGAAASVTVPTATKVHLY